MKIARNNNNMGFRLSNKAIKMLTKPINEYKSEIEFRSSPELIKVIELLGEKANGRIGTCKSSKIEIVEIPDNIEVEIVEYDYGYETIVEKHRTW